MIIVTKRAAFVLDHNPIWADVLNGEKRLCYYTNTGEPCLLGITGDENIAAALSRIATYAAENACACKLSDLCD